MQNKKFITKKLKILNKLSELGSATVESFLPKNYSFARPSRKALGLDEDNVYKDNTQNISVVLSKLKNDGLVERTGPKKKSFWKITSKGKDVIIKFNKGGDLEKKSATQQLIIFDIPEKDKKKRAWLRYKLGTLNYKMLQKSVWVGSSPLPEGLIHDLIILNLQKHIHIFSINKKGTLPEH